MIDDEELEIFFNPEEFATVALIQGKRLFGLKGSARIISNDVEIQKATFTCPSRSVRGISHGEKITVAAQPYRVVGIQQEGAGTAVLILEVA